MKKILILLILLIPFTSNGQNWLWAKGASGSSNSDATSSITDASGNIYLTGRFYSPSITFGAFTLTNISTTYRPSVFLVKYDVDGNVIWAKNYGMGADHYVFPRIAIDKSWNLYLTGTFAGRSADFGSTVLVNTGDTDRTEMYLVKLDTGGNVIWANGVGGIGVTEVNGLTIDNSNNIYITGDFRNYSIIFGTDTLSHTGYPGYSQLFLVKYDENGQELWAKTSGLINTDESNGYSVTVGENNSIYFVGNYTGASIVFGTDTIINTIAGTFDIFILKCDSLGNVIWGKNAGGNGDDYGFSTNIDSRGNFYLYGDFTIDSITLGGVTLGGGCCWNMFFARYDSAGKVIWAKNINHYVFTYTAFSDSSGNLFIGGHHGGVDPISFDGLTVPVGYYNIYVVKYNSSGNAQWAIGADSGGSRWMNSITPDLNGNIYASGEIFSPQISLGPTTITNDSAGENLFFAKLSMSVGPYFPHFLYGHSQSMTLCENDGPVSIDTLLAVNDSNMGTSVSWSILSGATHGALSVTYSTWSTKGKLIPSGLTYTPVTGYHGLDSFKVLVSDGAKYDTTAIFVSIDSLPLLADIVGVNSACVGSLLSLTDSTYGGVWSSSAPLIATIDTHGIVTCLAAGNSIISYSLPITCGKYFVVDTINIIGIPHAAKINGADTICVGSISTFTDSVMGGTWANYNTCTFISGGIVTGMLPGIDTIIYKVSNMCGSDSALKIVTVYTAPVIDSISGPSSVMAGYVITLTHPKVGGAWFSYDTSIAIVDSIGNVLGTTPGTVTIGYALTNYCGSDTVSTTIVVDEILKLPAMKIVSYPNPSKGKFTLIVFSDFNETAKINILNTTGSLVKSFETETNRACSVSIDGGGIFFLRVLSPHVSNVSKIMIEK